MMRLKIIGYLPKYVSKYSGRLPSTSIQLQTNQPRQHLNLNLNLNLHYLLYKLKIRAWYGMVLVSDMKLNMIGMRGTNECTLTK